MSPVSYKTLGRGVLSRTKRVEVTECVNFQFFKGETYSARFGFMVNSDGRCAMVLDDQHMSPKTAQARLSIQDFYLSEDISHLTLDFGQLRQSQLVVAVDKAAQMVKRGVFYGKSGQECLILFPDFGYLELVPATNLYATTELAAKTEFMGFFCKLYDVDLFSGSSLVLKSFEVAACAYGPSTQILKHSMSCEVLCQGFAIGWDDKVPIVDFWPIYAGVKTATPYNREMASCCAASWQRALAPKKVGDTFKGSVSHVSNTGTLFVHLLEGGEEETPAFYMEKYLRQFDIGNFQERFPRLTREAAATGKGNETIYLAEFEEDNVIYRARLLDVHNAGVQVEFIDYGNSAFVTYDKIFEAESVAAILTQIPPLTWHAHPCSIAGPTENNGAAVLEYFQETDEQGFILTFRVRDGNKDGIPLVTISGAKEDGGSYDVIGDMIDRDLLTIRVVPARRNGGY